MDINYYQTAAATTAVYPEKDDRTEKAINYCVVGLCGEVGELANKWKKVLRSDDEMDRKGLIDEVGDVLWYVSRLTAELGYSLNIVAERNLDKLQVRAARDRIRGSGDNR